MRADMPDAAASRKRQIQITPRPFRGAGAFRIRLTNGRYPLLRVWARLSGLGGPENSRWAQRLAWRGRRETWPMGEFRRVFRHAVSKSREIDSRSPAGRFDSRPRQGSKLSRTNAGGLPHAIDAFWSGKPGSHHLLPVFCPARALQRR